MCLIVANTSPLNDKSRLVAALVGYLLFLALAFFFGFVAVLGFAL